MGTKAGGQILSYNMFSKNGFDLLSFKKRIEEVSQKKNKIIIPLNFPNNQTGYNITEKEAESIKDILLSFAQKGLNIVIFADDAYFGLNYGSGIQKESIFTKFVSLHKRILALKIDGATKESFAWGLRVAFMTYATKSTEEALFDVLEKKTAGAIRAGISNASHLSQEIVLKALKSKSFEIEKSDKKTILENRAKKVFSIIKSKKYADVYSAYPCNSGYFISLKLKKNNAEALRIHLLNKYQIGIIALNDNDIRIAFSCLDEENIEEMFETIFKAINEI